jgi:uncharacterized protein (DUF58 family)
MSAVAQTLNRFMGGNATIPVTLGLRNIYILPTGYGLLYLLVLGAMLIGSINYNNNLGFLLTFLLGSLGLTAMMHTYSMLYGLRIAAVASIPVFAGEPAAIEITTGGIDRSRTGIRWYFSVGERVNIDFEPGYQKQVLISTLTEQRGIYDPGWLRIVCEYPLGLFQAWARVDTGLRCLVYPRPISGPEPGADTLSDFEEGDVTLTAGVDDFMGLSAYQPGDPPGRIHWQAYSRGRGLHTKTFAGQVGAGMLLDMKDISADDTERKLSILCFHVIRCYRQRRSVGLKLAGKTVPVGSGSIHRDRCLRALALFGKP